MDKSSKTITMDFVEYMQELRISENKGMNILMKAVNDIADNGGKNVRLENNASQELKDFIEKMKQLLAKE